MAIANFRQDLLQSLATTTHHNDTQQRLTMQDEPAPPNNDDQVTSSSAAESDASSSRWVPLSSRQRRVLGVLIEKARTTPDAYPMTLNAITNGCNQKSNRSPQMNLQQSDVEDVLEELRVMGVVAEVHGSGRVAKFRHYAYDWFAVTPKELAVLTELMLRGEQTLGDLRQRASRMDTIAHLDELRTIVSSLVARKLIWELTPPGRGQMVTHGLYTSREQERGAPQPVTSATGQPVPTAPASYSPPIDEPIDETSPSPETSDAPSAATPVSSQPVSNSADDGFLKMQVEELQQQVAEMGETIDELQERIEQLEERLRDLTQ